MSVEIDIDLPLGENIIEWREATGYQNLKVKINIVGTTIACVSMNDGTCRYAAPSPYVSINNFPDYSTIKGSLKAIAVGMCDWIDESGVTSLTLNHALYVFYLSEGATGAADAKYNILSPKPSRLNPALATLDNALGVFYYSEGAMSAGNVKTGCNYT